MQSGIKTVPKPPAYYYEKITSELISEFVRFVRLDGTTNLDTLITLNRIKFQGTMHFIRLIGCMSTYSNRVYIISNTKLYLQKKYENFINVEFYFENI